MNNDLAFLGAGREKETSLLDILDHVVNSGVVIQGSIVISLAGVDLIYLGLNVVLTSVETALSYIEHERRQPVLRSGKARKSKRA